MSADTPRGEPSRPDSSGGEAELDETVTIREAAGESAPRRIRNLEARVLELSGRANQLANQNEKLSATLREARGHISALREEIEKLTSPPASYGVFISPDTDGTAIVAASGRKFRVSVLPEIDLDALRGGQEVLLNDAMSLIGVREFERQGELVTIKEILDDGRAIVIGNTDDEKVVEVSDALSEVPLHAGDSARLDSRSGHLLERLPRPEVEELVLEEIPDVGYDDIGGLADQIEAIQDAVELPFLHGDLYAEHRLPAPKGVLLYGPPGCGKTLIAKAVASSLAKKVAAKSGRSDARSYFLNVKGPELLNKYVGETERQIRLIFQRAREKSDEGVPVIVFFDEMDSLFRTRGSGISSDIETTIVPQLLSEIDGVESLKNVIVVGASNREDLIDPAILRPGRLDVKIKINRPDVSGAKEIFRKYLTEDLPFHEKELEQESGDVKAVIAHMVDSVVPEMYSTGDENRFLEVTYANGDKEVLFFKDFASGAMIENIVRRAKKEAIKRLIESGERGIRTDDLSRAVKQEFREHEDLPNTTNPDDWAKISGKKGERIVYVRTLVKTGVDEEGGRSIERINTGQYL
ncbi:MAG: proteasome ATPase [Acidobacteria bacterium]|nr:MAG: proteasome ATPase [Acidobacteriota bacterium]